MMDTAGTDKNILLAGAAREVITPPVGGRLYGYFPDLHSTSVHDDLTFTVLCLRSGPLTVLIASATVCLINTELCNELRARMADAAGTDPGSVIVCATHTHSGPCTDNEDGFGEVDREYCDSILIPAAVRAAGRAAASLSPALVGVSSVKSDVGVNRRQMLRSGVVQLGQNPWGCRDPEMTLVRLLTPEGEGIINIIHYGAHCTACGPNKEISRDWAGVMTDALERDSGTLTMFLNGAEGDVGPRLTNGGTTGDIRYAMELGGVAARDAADCYHMLKGYVPASLSRVTGQICLPYREPMPEKQARDLLAPIDRDDAVNLDYARIASLRAIISAYENNVPFPQAMTIGQTVVSLGPVAFVPFPFEIFSEISLRTRAFSPFPYTLCLGASNGSGCYLPSRDQMIRGGYEIDMFHCRGLYTLADDTDDHIIDQDLELLEALKCTE